MNTKDTETTTTFFVATRTCYVILEASGSAEAIHLAIPELRKIFDRPDIEIHTVRVATDDEVTMNNWHQANLLWEKRNG